MRDKSEHGKGKIVVLWRTSDVMEFVDVAREHADKEKRSLGFLPERVYGEAANQEKLFIAVIRTGKHDNYAGHLLFGGVFPQARVFQAYAIPDFRQLSP